MYKGAHVDDGTVNGQGIGAQVLHDLPIEQHGQDAHGHVNEEGGKPSHGDFMKLPQDAGRLHKPQGVGLFHKVGQHHNEGKRRADGRGQTSTINAHVAGKHEKVIAENVEDAAGQHPKGSQARIVVIPQEGGQHLIEQEQGENPQDGRHVGFSHDQQAFICTEEGEHGLFKAENACPAQNGQQHRTNDGNGKVLHFTAVMDGVAAPLGTENHAAADTH